MKKFLFAVLALSLYLPAHAACTWTGNAYGVQGACDNTPAAPSTTDGLSLEGSSVWSAATKGFVVIVEAAGAMTAGGILQAYLRNPNTGTWVRVADGSLDLTVSAVTNQGFLGMYVPVSKGRIAYVPSGLGVSSTVHIIAQF